MVTGTVLALAIVDQNESNIDRRPHAFSLRSMPGYEQLDNRTEPAFPASQPSLDFLKTSILKIGPSMIENIISGTQESMKQGYPLIS